MPQRPLLLVMILLTLGLLPLLSAAPVTKPAGSFAFEKGDVVAIYGNGLADRMQHTPWVEAVLQEQLEGLDVRFRNLSFSGDTVAARPRSKGFISDPAYLGHVDPDVIFMMYGYNESYAGPEGAAAYEEELVAP